MKPSFFGQVVFPSSRAVDEFSDDFDEDIKNPYEINISEKTPLGCINTLLIASCLPSTNFAKVYVLPTNAKPTLTVSIFRKSGSSLEEESSKPCYILDGYFVDSSKTLVILSSASIDSHVCYELTERLLSFLPNAGKVRVIVLDTKPMIDYVRSDGSRDFNSSSFMRMIKTQSCRLRVEDHIEPLTIPNILDGFSAAILSYCQMNDVDASAFVVYTSQAVLDPSSVECFYVLRNISDLSNLIKDKSNVTDLDWKALHFNSDLSLYA